MEEGTVLKRYKPYIIILIAVLLAEIFVFNWRFFEGIGYESVELNSYSCGSGVTNSGINEITVLSGGDKSVSYTHLDVYKRQGGNNRRHSLRQGCAGHYAYGCGEVNMLSGACPYA